MLDYRICLTLFEDSMMAFGMVVSLDIALAYRSWHEYGEVEGPKLIKAAFTSRIQKCLEQA